MNHQTTQNITVFSSAMSHLLLSAASVFLQHLQQVFMFSIKLSHLLSVELQQLTRRPQVRQTLRDGGQRRLTTDTNTETGRGVCT